MADKVKKAQDEGTTIDTDAQGTVKISETVVENIAGLAAREVAGVFDLGKSGLRRVLGGAKPARGVDVEVGQKEVAIDLDLIVHYGHNIPEVCANVRAAITDRVRQMTGLICKELNINVIDIHFPDTEKKKPEPRVQ